MVRSDDARRRVMEQIVDVSISNVELSTLAFPNGAWPASVEVTVNGALRVPNQDYWATPVRITLVEALLPGDTLRISALGSQP